MGGRVFVQFIPYPFISKYVLLDVPDDGVVIIESISKRREKIQILLDLYI